MNRLTQMIHTRGPILALLIGLGMSGPAWAAALGTVFSYQGQLKDNGTPAATGSYQMIFELYDGPDPVLDTLLGTVGPQAVQVTDGLFTEPLDFGAGVFTGDARWLRITVEGTPLSPLHPITPAPYALFAVDGPGAGATPWQFNGADVYYNAGDVGIGESDPQSKLHVRTKDLALAASALENDEIIVEGQDAVLGLYSEAQGSWASAIALKEVSGGVVVDTWGIARRTSTATSPSSLRFTYGPSDNYATNPSVLALANDGNVGIGTVEPAEKLTVAGDILVDGSGTLDLTLSDDGEFGSGLLMRGGCFVPPVGCPQAAIGYDGSTLRLAATDTIFFGDGHGMHLTNAGNVGFGTSNPNSSKAMTIQGYDTGTSS